MPPEDPAVVFEDLRPYLHGVAYRLTSSWADAEDVVADAWPRWAQHVDSVADPKAWLTRVVARLAVDHLRSARVRREAYVGSWLPEPIVTAPGVGAPGDPLVELVTDESVRFAFLVVLDTLTPEQRVAAVLHDVLDVPFAEVAEVLGCTDAAARQHAVRARRRIRDADVPPRAPVGEAYALLGELTDALRDGDTAALTRLLAPEVVLLADGAGEVHAAGRPLRGAAEVGRFLQGLLELTARHGVRFRTDAVLVNGDPGVVVTFDNPRPGDPAIAVYHYVLRDGVVSAVYGMLAPQKLTRLPRLAAPSPAHTPPPS